MECAGGHVGGGKRRSPRDGADYCDDRFKQQYDISDERYTYIYIIHTSKVYSAALKVDGY